MSLTIELQRRNVICMADFCLLGFVRLPLEPAMYPSREDPRFTAPEVRMGFRK